MEEKGSLGIFLLRDKAVAVWTSTGSEGDVLHQLCMTPSADDPATFGVQMARAVNRQGFAFDEAFVAIDCGSYTQYELHSEFEDIRQIENTIKFDAEEAAATDAANLAVTFEVTAALEPGSRVTAYTADRQLLTDILLDVEEGGLDPTFMEPDVICLARALEQTSKLSERTGSLFVILSGSHCYLLRPNAGYAPIARTLLVQQGKDITQTLAREVLLATAATKQQQSLESVVLIGNAGTIDAHALSRQTGLEVLTETPEKALSLTVASDSPMTSTELLIAFGAAMAARTKGHKADFRRDFMPYQGKRKVMEGSFRLISISLAVLLLAAACFYQFKTFRVKGYTNDLADKTILQYQAVMYGKSPPKGANPSTKLKTVLNQVKNEQNAPGAGDNKSVPAKLTFFLEAVNSCNKRVDINIQQMTITERSMKVKGDTNSRSSTNALFNAVKKHSRITLASQRYGTSSGRDTFEITIDPKK